MLKKLNVGTNDKRERQSIPYLMILNSTMKPWEISLYYMYQ